MCSEIFSNGVSDRSYYVLQVMEILRPLLALAEVQDLMVRDFYLLKALEPCTLARECCDLPIQELDLTLDQDLVCLDNVSS